ncbi:hypothetical protein FO440_18295 [Mucilaginibacter corticis]|uniref:Succinyl-CoA--3-ketoacid-CoA transferase n=1 Tax=Mucilaginibacter corticis TaxID=2597670 RepID=A0A556MIE9_9SPHI|nr:CoA-transferase [Mucilaginibacter corticis]TSJ39690.1 hypothetical protein FO440_18295 [Mucilaginibacter corticis]
MYTIFKDARQATADIPDGATLMLEGFGLCGIPENGIAALLISGVKDLTCISNNAVFEDFDIGLLLHRQRFKKMITSYVGEKYLMPRHQVTWFGFAFCWKINSLKNLEFY